MNLFADPSIVAPPRAGQYVTVMADPPWNESGGGKIKRGADRHYPLMRYPEIERVVTGVLYPDDASAYSVVDRDAHLWCWVTDNYLRDGLRLVDALGFRYVRTLCWFKSGRFGIGQYLRGKHELCLFAVRGRLPASRRDQPSAFEAERAAHSVKPERAYA